MYLADKAFVLWRPRHEFDKAINAIFGKYSHVHKWLHGPRTTPETQIIIHSSVEQAFSVCYIDLREGPYHILMNPSRSYFSLAVYADNTDTVFIENNVLHPEGFDLTLDLESRRNRGNLKGRIVYLPTSKNLLMARRLAPDDTSFAEADQVRQKDICRVIE